jgi:TRAP-type C4-dicarboxylate transport system permease small subunit
MSLIALVAIAFLALIFGFLAMILVATWRQVDEEWDAERSRRGGSRWGR